MRGTRGTKRPRRVRTADGAELLLSLLSLVNSCPDPREFSDALSAILKIWLNCSSVQLKYLGSEDLSPRTRPCLRGLADSSARQKPNTDGQAGTELCKDYSFLDCIGARLLTGDRVEISGVRLTPNGSFWTNNLTDILKENQPRDKNGRQECCSGNGLKSIMLTPLKHEDSVFGLLIATDTRSGHFTERSIAIAEEIARFLARLRGESKREERYHAFFEGAGVGLIKENFSRVKEFINRLEGSGEDNLLKHFNKNPADVTRCADMVVIEDVNRVALDIYDAATKADFVSGFRAFFMDESHEAFKRLLVALHEGETRFHINTVNRSLNGELRQLSLGWFISPVDEEKWSQIICSVEDITERKRVVDRLNEQLLFFQTLIDTVPTPIFYKDTEHRYLGCNRAFEIYGKTRKQDVIGKTIFDLLGDTRKARIHDLADGELLRNPGKKLYESSIEHVNGKKSTTIHRKATFVRPDGTSAGIVGVILDITEQKVAEDRLRKSQEELRNLSRRLQYVREEERKAISREIHDQLGQTLAVLQMELALLMKKVPSNQKGLIEGTKQLKKRVREAIEIVRSISARTRPEMLDDLGLAAAIEWQAMEFQKLTGVKCVVKIDQTDKEIEANLSTALFRILQEALTNVWRHSHATHVRVMLRLEGDALVLEVHDNGKGITEKQANDSTSTGLIGMRERVHPWAGQVSIEGLSNAGTTVKVTVPLRTVRGEP